MRETTLSKTAVRNISREIRKRLNITADERVGLVENTCKLLIESRFGRVRAWENFSDFVSRPEAEDEAAVEFGDNEVVPWYSISTVKDLFKSWTLKPATGSHSEADILTDSFGTQLPVQTMVSQSSIRPPPNW